MLVFFSIDTMTGVSGGFFDQKGDSKFHVVFHPLRNENKKEQSDCWHDKPHYTHIIDISSLFLSKNIVLELWIDLTTLTNV